MTRRSRGRRDYERGERVGELLRRILADEIEQLDDDRLELLTITGVDVDNELSLARVYWSSYAGDDDAITDALHDHAGELRRAIGQQARLRRTPRLEFAPDHGIREGARIDEILRSLETDDPGA